MTSSQGSDSDESFIQNSILGLLCGGQCLLRLPSE